MARLLRCMLAVALVAGCGSKSSTPDAGFDAGSDVDDDDDAGVVLRDPNVADTLGPATGTYDVNGAGELFALQVDTHLALQVNGQPNLFIGHIAADGGAFDAGLVYPDLEDCGPSTLTGSFTGAAKYTATEVFCTNGEQVSGPVAGSRYYGAKTYAQNLAWSGAYDVTETPAADSQCASAIGAHKLVVGVARDLDGGAVVALLAGDGLLDEVVFGKVNASNVLAANAQDPLGRSTSTFTLGFLVDGGVGGTRSVDLGTRDEPCPASLVFAGAKR